MILLSQQSGVLEKLVVTCLFRKMSYVYGGCRLLSCLQEDVTDCYPEPNTLTAFSVHI